MGAGMAVPGRPAQGDDAPQVFHNFVGPRFFETMGIAVLAGRDFDVIDDERAAKHVVITAGVARRYFGDGDPIGRQILVGDPGCRRCPPPSLASIVGVVKDVRYSSLRADAPLMIYRPYRQQPGAPADTFLIRTSSADADALAPLLRAELRRAAPALPPPSVVSLADTVAAVLVEERMLAALSTAIGALAAMLAAIGIYSIVAATVRRRQREIGIRMALGAPPRQVAGMVVSEALAIVAAGLAIGVPGGDRRGVRRSRRSRRRALRAVADRSADVEQLGGRHSPDRRARGVRARTPGVAHRSCRRREVRGLTDGAPTFLLFQL